MNNIQLKRVIADHREELESIRSTDYVKREKLEQRQLKLCNTT